MAALYLGNKLIGISKRDSRIVNNVRDSEATQNLLKEPKRKKKTGIERIMIKGKHFISFRHNRGGSFPH
jgi:hypothetical protein